MNLNNPVIKGALMLLLTSILSMATNMPADNSAWTVFGLTTLGTMIGYFAQSSLFPATSETGQLNGKDLLKGLLVALSNGLSTWAATAIEGTVLSWKTLLITTVGMFAGYVLKQLGTTAPKS
jgi:hypothetical protein